MYVDESGDTGLENSPSDYFVLSGIVVHEEHWRAFINHLVDFKKTVRNIYGLPLRDEIHASEFIQSKVVGLNRHERLALLRNTLDELTKFPNISITNIIVEKAGKPQNFDVFGVAWRTLFQRFENTLIHGNFPGKHKNDNGLIFTDATSGKKLSNIMRKMSVHNPIPNNQQYGNGYQNHPIKRIIEDPYGLESNRSLPIQMADVCADFLHQRYKPNGYIKKKRAQYYFDRLKPVLNLKASRLDTLGIVKI